MGIGRLAEERLCGLGLCSIGARGREQMLVTAWGKQLIEHRLDEKWEAWLWSLAWRKCAKKSRFK